MRWRSLSLKYRRLRRQLTNKYALVIPMEKFFNNAGPIQKDIHYSVDPLSRINIEEIKSFIGQRKYFVLHAPRQTGKTSMLLALRDYLNAKGEVYCVYANVEAGQAMRNDVKEVNNTILSQFGNRISHVIKDYWPMELAETMMKNPSSNSVNDFLTKVCLRLEKPLVLFIDEIDSLVGDSLVSVLRQIRSGYDQRPEMFPQSIVLCGVRDVRDYRIVLSNQDIITGGSAFNIKSKTLRMGNFTREEIRQLYQQHTDETGQVFDEGCFDMVWNATEGQPWLVNAIANEVTYEMEENRDRKVRIIPEMIYKAQERIIYRRDTHIDILIDKLREPRVKRVIEPILIGDSVDTVQNIKDDDIKYVEDLGLIVRDKPLRISNAIYREIIPRELTWSRQQTLLEQPIWYMNPDNSINISKLLKDFQRFYRENAEAWIDRFEYREAGPQLLVQAFLQRIVNGGGYIDREYGLGQKRTDILIRKPLTEQYGGPVQKIVLELKIKYNSLEKEIDDALKQTEQYIERTASELKEAHILIFDRNSQRSWDEKIYEKSIVHNGRTYTVWGC